LSTCLQRFFVGISVTLAFAGLGHSASLTVAAASDLASAERDLTNSFQRTHRNDSVRFVFAASGTLRQQIANGAPYDVFLSANAAYIDQLASNRKILPDTAVVYAHGQLAALWRDHKLHDINDLIQNWVRFVALANPKLAPYGLAAQQSLEHAGLWAKLRPKIVFGENVRQTLQMFDSGNADVVLTAYSLMVKRPGVQAIPENWHQPILQKGGVVAASHEASLAREFLAFLQSPAGASVLRAHGLSPVARHSRH
jgi:molybdate transport system substrate-binding protein